EPARSPRFSVSSRSSCPEPTKISPHSDQSLWGLIYLSTYLLPLRRIDQRDDPLEIVDGGEIDADLALRFTQLNLHARVEMLREPMGQLRDLRRYRTGVELTSGRGRFLSAESHDLLEATHR